MIVGRAIRFGSVIRADARQRASQTREAFDMTHNGTRARGTGRRIAAAVAAVTASMALAGCAVATTSQLASMTKTAPDKGIGDAVSVPPCATEDSPGDGHGGPCYWNAKTEGNGQGKSFVAWPEGASIMGHGK